MKIIIEHHHYMHEAGHSQQDERFQKMMVDAFERVFTKMNSLFTQNHEIMTKQQELAGAINELALQVGKVGEESKKTLQKVSDLEQALANQDNVSPELQSAFDNLKAQVVKVDELIPDAPGPVEVPAPGEVPEENPPAPNPDAEPQL